jgi:hypothetical protein
VMSNLTPRYQQTGCAFSYRGGEASRASKRCRLPFACAKTLLSGTFIGINDVRNNNVGAALQDERSRIPLDAARA